MKRASYTLLGCYFFMLLRIHAQDQQSARPLSAYDRQAIMLRIGNTPDGQRIQDMQLLMNNFPAMAGYYQSRIDALLEQNRYVLNGLPVMQEESRWQEYLRNIEYRQHFGHDPLPTQLSIAEAESRQLHGKPPSPTRNESMRQQMALVLQEAEWQSRRVNDTDYYHSPQYLNDVPHYTDAKSQIKAMLEGKQPLLVKDAYYAAEAAYGDLQLTYEEYNALIQSNAAFIRQWLLQNRYDARNPEMLHYGIQKFMSDTLRITMKGKRHTHLPYYYDYIDATAQDDKRNYFVTKTLATGTGQCHTLPVLYMILAEALGVEAFIAYNPQHSFIRYRNNKGTIINYETTVDRFLADAFYLQTLPVMARAQKNRLYIQSLTRRQVVASVLYDLAANFIKEHWTADRLFINDCMAIAKPYFPDQAYVSTTESYLRQRFYADDINARVQAKGVTNASELEQDPALQALYNNYAAYMNKLATLGVQEFPEEERLRMLAYADTKGKLQVAKGIRSKEKRSLFID